MKQVKNWLDIIFTVVLTIASAIIIYEFASRFILQSQLRNELRQQEKCKTISNLVMDCEIEGHHYIIVQGAGMSRLD